MGFEKEESWIGMSHWNNFLGEYCDSRICCRDTAYPSSVLKKLEQKIILKMISQFPPEKIKNTPYT
jgi:hypothetical protein